METNERDALLKLYADRVAEMGYDVRSVGWKSVEDQVLRFKVLSEIGVRAGDSVCDVGCGFGDLEPYLTSTIGPVRYAGVDISDELLTVARARHPELRFTRADILDEGYSATADWHLLSGALSFKLEDNLSFTRRMLERMLELSTKGVAANFLSTYVNYQHPRNFHYDPSELLRMGKNMTPKVALRHDYPLWEFTIYLYK
ncbi:MAG TPA: methyltransferase domain-containing protein [Polyangia bacterium]|nr:methyltransferase domain-containing protein [Polyangia bacterium]